jgi:Tol biopolymer transport system component
MKRGFVSRTSQTSHHAARMSIRFSWLAALLLVGLSAGAGSTQSVAPASVKVLVYGVSGWIWRADVDGRDSVRVARGLYPEVSPDGRWVAFVRRTRTRDLFELHVAALDGRTKRLVRRGHVTGYAWLSDSARLLIHDLNKGVLLADRKGGAVARLAPQWVPGAGAINVVSIAPDAIFVIFDRRNTRGSDVFAVPVGGGPERRLTVDGNSSAPVAGPTTIAFSRHVVGRRPHGELWLMERDGANQRQLSQTVERPAFWSADGRRLIAVNISGTFSGGWFGEIWTVDPATNVSRSLYKRPVEGLHAAGLSRDGKRVLAVRGCVSWGLSGKATPGRIETIPADGGKPHVLIRGACYASWNA